MRFVPRIDMTSTSIDDRSKFVVAWSRHSVSSIRPCDPSLHGNRCRVLLPVVLGFIVSRRRIVGLSLFEQVVKLDFLQSISNTALPGPKVCPVLLNLYMLSIPSVYCPGEGKNLDLVLVKSDFLPKPKLVDL